MVKKEEKKRHTGVIIILLLSIAFLNLLGISYAEWNNDVDIATKFLTGNADIKFCDHYIKTNNGEENLRVDYNHDNTIMFVKGEVSSDYNGFLHYYVKNNGTVPVKFKSKILNPNDSIKLKRHIKSNCKKAGEETNESNNIMFNCELLFKQWNN